MEFGSSLPSVQPLERLFELSVDMLGTASTDGYFTHLNPAWERTLGWTCEELMAEPFISFVHPDDVAATTEAALRLADPAGSSLVAFENRYRTRDGGFACIEWAVVSDGSALYFVAKDVTARRAAEGERDRAASLAKAITESVVDGVYVVDAENRLTFVNPAAASLLGYGSAEELLGKEAHATFHHSHLDGRVYPVEECPLVEVRRTGQPCRIEEDVFWRKDGTQVAVAASAAPLELGRDTGSVVTFRDITTLQAERERLRAQARHVLWFNKVREALDEDRFVLYGQPVLSLKSGEVICHELLLRMIAPAGDAVSPGLFLPAAEQYGLIGEIDRWVITEATRLAAAGRHVAANLSAESVGRVEILLHLERELQRNGAPPENLTIEVTETALMADIEEGRRFGDRLVALGCAFSLDDFGTGYGSLTYLRRLPITDIKIDVQFVRDIAHSETDRKLVQGIVNIAASLGKGTIAEGVEDEETLNLLKGLGVGAAQGYYIGMPAPITTP